MLVKHDILELTARKIIDFNFSRLSNGLKGCGCCVSRESVLSRELILLILLSCYDSRMFCRWEYGQACCQLYLFQPITHHPAPISFSSPPSAWLVPVGLCLQNLLTTSLFSDEINIPLELPSPEQEIK